MSGPIDSEKGATKVEYSLLSTVLLVLLIPILSFLGPEVSRPFDCAGEAMGGAACGGNALSGNDVPPELSSTGESNSQGDPNGEPQPDGGPMPIGGQTNTTNPGHEPLSVGEDPVLDPPAPDGAQEED